MWILLSHRAQISLTFSWCARVLALVLRCPGRFCEATGAGCELKVHGCLGRASCHSEARCHLRRERETKRVDRERRSVDPEGCVVCGAAAAGGVAAAAGQAGRLNAGDDGGPDETRGSRGRGRGRHSDSDSQHARRRRVHRATNHLALLPVLYAMASSRIMNKASSLLGAMRAAPRLDIPRRHVHRPLAADWSSPPAISSNLVPIVIEQTVSLVPDTYNTLLHFCRDGASAATIFSLGCSGNV